MSPFRLHRVPLRVFISVAVTTMVVSFGSGLLILALSYNRSDRAIHAIQAERTRNIREVCETQNRRNAVAYEFLKALPRTPGQPRRSPQEQERLLRGFTDALVGPVRNCAVVVARTAPSAR